MLAEGRQVVIRHDGSVDALAAAVILEHTLGHYLRRPAPVLGAADPVPPGAFTITLGSHVPAAADGFGLGLRDARTIRYSIST